MTKQKINKEAFTLVELIVVITILAILWTIAFISLQWYSKDARDGVRISDVSNMKTALELFHLDAWKYPLPDSGETVVYSWATVWTQWEFWDTVISSLSRSLDHAPTDPLSDKKYIYSVSWNKNQFEILNLIEWEWDIALWNISQTNAVATTRIPKINGIYNGLYVKTGNYIVVTPSLITALEYTDWDDLSSTILSSMVVEWYDNVPDAWNAATQTWAISWIVLSATWIINKDSTDAEKISVMRTIQNAYTWSDLAWSDVYEYVLSKTSDEDILAISESIVLNNSSAWWTSNSNNVTATIYSSCRELLTNEPSTVDGTYTIDPEINWTWFDAYCDMTRDWWGWTLVAYWVWNEVWHDTDWKNTNTVNLVDLAGMTTTAKMSDSLINTVRATWDGNYMIEVPYSTAKRFYQTHDYIHDRVWSGHVANTSYLSLSWDDAVVRDASYTEHRQWLSDSWLNAWGSINTYDGRVDRWWQVWGASSGRYVTGCDSRNTGCDLFIWVN